MNKDESQSPKQELAKIDIEFPSQEEQDRTGFTVVLVKNIYDNLVAGMSLPDCAKLLRMPVLTINKWYRENYCGFGYLVDQAQTQDKQRYVVNMASGVDALKIKSAMWMLERKHKGEYSKETIHTVNNVVIDGTANAFFDALKDHIQDPELINAIVKSTMDKLHYMRMDNVDGDTAKILVEEALEEAVNNKDTDTDTNTDTNTDSEDEV